MWYNNVYIYYLKQIFIKYDISNIILFKKHTGTIIKLVRVGNV